MSIVKANIIVDDDSLRFYEDLSRLHEERLQKEVEAKFGKEVLLVLYTNWLRSDANQQNAQKSSREVSIDLTNDKLKVCFSFSKIEAETIISYCEENYDLACRYYGCKLIDTLKEACKHGEN